MGIADFYLKVNFKNNNSDEVESICQLFNEEKIFRILDKESDMKHLSLECKFDNFIPSVVVAFENLYTFKDNIASVETHGALKEFVFNSIDDFLIYVFSSNRNQLLSYYRQMGYFAIGLDKYYKRRIKLKKYYKKWNKR